MFTVITRLKVVREDGMYQRSKKLSSWRKEGESTMEIGWRSLQINKYGTLHSQSRQATIVLSVISSTGNPKNFQTLFLEELSGLSCWDPADGPATVASPSILYLSPHGIVVSACAWMIDLWKCGGAESHNLSIELRVPIAVVEFFYCFFLLHYRYYHTTLQGWGLVKTCLLLKHTTPSQVTCVI